MAVAPRAPAGDAAEPDAHCGEGVSDTTRASSTRPMAIGVVVVWLALMAYFWPIDLLSFYVAVIVPPIFGAAFLLSMRVNSTVLPIFTALAFVSHGIAPPFFFLNRLNYQPSGFGAVRDFRFGLGEFLDMDAGVVVFVFALVAWMAIMSSRSSQSDAVSRGFGNGRPRYDVLLILFVLLIAVPQTLLMYGWRQGITGVIAEPLGYRLTGVLYYTRMFLYPILIFTGLALARRHALTALVLFAYAVIGGISASSRYVLASSIAPVILFALVDRKRLRLAVLGVAFFAAFVLVTKTREFVYVEPDITFSELASKSLEGISQTPEGMSHVGWLIDSIGGIANRIWGPQDIVLAAQYQVPNRLDAIWTYFTLGTVVQDLTYEFFGMTFEAGSGFGVGIGFIPWMVVISSGNWLFLIGLALLTALMLRAADLLVDRIRRSGVFGAWVFAEPIGFLCVYVMYSSAMNWFYQLMLVLVVAVTFLGAVERAVVRRPVEA
jgi:hypothetical protein